MGRSAAKGFAATITELSVVRLEEKVQSPSVHAGSALWETIWEENLQHDVQEMWMVVCLRYQCPLLFYLQSIVATPRWGFKAMQNTIYKIDQIKIHVDSTNSNMLWHCSNMWRIDMDLNNSVLSTTLISMCWKKICRQWEEEGVCLLQKTTSNQNAELGSQVPMDTSTKNNIALKT